MRGCVIGRMKRFAGMRECVVISSVKGCHIAIGCHRVSYGVPEGEQKDVIIAITHLISYIPRPLALRFP